MVCEDYKKQHPVKDRTTDFDEIEYALVERMKVECLVWKHALVCKIKPTAKRYIGLVDCYMHTPEPKPVVEETKAPEKPERSPAKATGKSKAGRPVKTVRVKT